MTPVVSLVKPMNAQSSVKMEVRRFHDFIYILEVYMNGRIPLLEPVSYLFVISLSFGVQSSKIIFQFAGSCFLSPEATPTCACHEAYTGKFCEFDIDDCAVEPCLNQGTCVQKSDPTAFDAGKVRDSLFRSFLEFIFECKKIIQLTSQTVVIEIFALQH